MRTVAVPVASALAEQRDARLALRRDRQLLATVILWIVVAGIIVYTSGGAR